MASGKQNLPNVIVFCAASGLLVLGMVASHWRACSNFSSAEAAAGLVSAAPRPSSASTAPAALERVSQIADRPAPKLSVVGKPAPAQARPVAPPAPRRRAPAQVGGGSRGPLPPFLPPLYGPEMVASTPPDGLRLAGVIGGDKRLAVLRYGESRYLVREGDTFAGGYRVIGISASSVTLRRGARKQTLRLGD